MNPTFEGFVHIFIGKTNPKLDFLYFVAFALNFEHKSQKNIHFVVKKNRLKLRIWDVRLKRRVTVYKTGVVTMKSIIKVTLKYS